MPLSFVKTGQKGKIRKVGGKEDTRRFLSSLGFIEGADIEIVSENGGNMIVLVKGARVAISREMAGKILIA